MQKYMHFAYKNMLIFNNHQVLLSSRLNKHFIIEKPKDIIRNIIAEAYAFCIKNMLMFNNHHILLSSRLNKHFIIETIWYGKSFYYGMYLDDDWKKKKSVLRPTWYHQKYNCKSYELACNLLIPWLCSKILPIGM